MNLAMHVEDEMVLYIPMVGELVQETQGFVQSSNGGLSAGSLGSESNKININSADEAELETLPGIGPSKSAAIIEYRTTTGPFKSIEDIQSISGIGEKTFEKLKDKIAID
ncbi:ComE operon protein 1 [Bacillus sp. 1NLA3E]|nr:ComE operon protein 1 [Bacillus sp. 1NLA3E]